MRYEIKIEDIKKNYINVKKNSFEHNARSRIQILPYTTQYKKSQKDEIVNFMAAVGEFSRIINKKKNSNTFDIERYYNEVINEVSMEQKNKSIFKEMITELFFEDKNLIKFHPKSLNYIEATPFNKKIGKFLVDVLYKDNNEMENLIINAYGRESNNILINLMIKKLPQLEEFKENKITYKTLFPYISDIFCEDVKYLFENKNLLINNIEKFLKYYYMFYVSQLSLVLNKTFEADLKKPIELYFMFDWENTSRGRLNTEIGWNIVESNILRVFSHANTLDLLNHNNENKIYSYVELKERIDNMNNEEKIDFINNVNGLIDFYRRYIDVEWDNFKHISKFDDKCYEVVYKLFKTINYQFDNSGRRERQRDYGTWFVEFCKDNFLRLRGRYGYILNLTEDYTILLTKLCIKNNEKIKLKDLFSEFKRRGICLDNDSKLKLTQFYEKLNILEKKSDSGDAQYVKRIL